MTAHAERGLEQRIGLAVSDDLHDWRRSDAPVLTADPDHYETLDTEMWHDEAWHDPWMFFDPDDDHVHAPRRPARSTPDLTGPTGRFGFVADDLHGPYRPLNGHGCVFANPHEEALQAYSWLVLNDLTTISFVDAHSLKGTSHTGSSDEVARDRSQFGGTIAPPLRLGPAGDRIDEVDVAVPI